MDPLFYDDEFILDILHNVQVIAMVGASAKWNRPSSFAMKYLQAKGYKVIPVNPGVAGQEILGETVYASLADIPGSYDMVDMFQAPKRIDATVDLAISLANEKNISVIWMQLGIINQDAADRAEKAGLKVVMDRCPKIEYGRLYGELGWGGVNSGIISSKRPKVRRV